MKEIWKLFGIYRLNKSLWSTAETAAPAYEPGQKHKVTHGIPVWLNYVGGEECLVLHCMCALDVQSIPIQMIDMWSRVCTGHTLHIMDYVHVSPFIAFCCEQIRLNFTHSCWTSDAIDPIPVKKLRYGLEHFPQKYSVRTADDNHNKVKAHIYAIYHKFLSQSSTRPLLCSHAFCPCVFVWCLDCRNAKIKFQLTVSDDIIRWWINHKSSYPTGIW